MRVRRILLVLVIAAVVAAAAMMSSVGPALASVSNKGNNAPLHGQPPEAVAKAGGA